MTGVLPRLAGAGLLAGAATLAWAVVESEQYVLREATLPGVLRPGSRPLRVLHLADLHLSPPGARRVAFVASLADVEVDVVAATGDLLGDVDAEDATVAALAPLTADGTPGLVVLGSNDLYAPIPKSPTRYLTRNRAPHGTPLDTPRFVRGLVDTGWDVLRNGDRRLLDLDGTSVAVGAIDDPHLLETVVPDAADLVPLDPDADLLLGLVHAPYVEALDALERAGHRLLLAGHTHGGQLRFPPLGALVANCDLPLDRVRGTSRYGRAWLHVTAGLGTSKYTPVRLACRPEATVLTLLPAHADTRPATDPRSLAGAAVG